MGKIIEDNDSEDSYTRNSEQEIKTQANSSWKHWRVNASCDHLKADVLRMRTITGKKENWKSDASKKTRGDNYARVIWIVCVHEVERSL